MENPKASGAVHQMRVVLLLVLSVSMVSSASILILVSTSPPLVIVFWRTLYGAMLMAVIGAARGDSHAIRGTLLKKNWRWLIFTGVMLSLHFSAWFTSLTMTSLAASVVLTDSSPIFTAVLSTLVLKEPLRRMSWAGVIVAVTGAVALSWSDLVSTGSQALAGDLLALLSAVFLAVYFIGGRRFAKGLPVSVYTSTVYASAAASTLVLCLISGTNIAVFETREVVIFLALAIFPTVLGHSVNNYLLTIVPAYVVSSAVLGEPIGATLLGVIILNRIPSVETILGFAVILIGVGLVIVDLAVGAKRGISTLDYSDGP